jgi:hypothetical protein
MHPTSYQLLLLSTHHVKHATDLELACVTLQELCCLRSMSSDEDEALELNDSGLPRSASLPVLPGIEVQHERIIIHIDIDCFYAQVYCLALNTINVVIHSCQQLFSL